MNKELIIKIVDKEITVKAHKSNTQDIYFGDIEKSKGTIDFGEPLKPGKSLKFTIEVKQLDYE